MDNDPYIFLLKPLLLEMLTDNKVLFDGYVANFYLLDKVLIDGEEAEFEYVDNVVIYHPEDTSTILYEDLPINSKRH